MQNNDELRVVQALELMEAASLNINEVLDIGAAVRQVKVDRERANTRLQALEADLTRVAALLRTRTEAVSEESLAARETIAAHFMAGALAVGQARAAFEAATGDLEYLRYLVL